MGIQIIPPEEVKRLGLDKAPLGPELLGWNTPITYKSGDKGGSAEFHFTLGNPKELTVKTEGSAFVTLPEKIKYEIEIPDELFIEDDTHWAKARKRFSKGLEYVDILFGVKDDELNHYHLGFTINTDSLVNRFNMIRREGNTTSKEYYHEDMGAILPMERVILDKETNRSVKIIFSIDKENKKIKIDKFLFEN